MPLTQLSHCYFAAQNHEIQSSFWL